MKFAAIAGLCPTCTHCRIIDSAKGSRFYLCQLGVDKQAGFPKYPHVPVLRCHGFKQETADSSSQTQ